MIIFPGFIQPSDTKSHLKFLAQPAAEKFFLAGSSEMVGSSASGYQNSLHLRRITIFENHNGRYRKMLL